MDYQRVLIDTSIIIDHLRKKDKSRTVFYKIFEKSNIAISVVSEFELKVGINKKNKETTLNIFNDFELLQFDSKCSTIASDIYIELKKQNKQIALADLFIASTAISNNLPLYTFNYKHFTRVKNLNLLKIDK